MVAALALGPAIGGASTRLGPAMPFRAAAVVAMLVAVIVADPQRIAEGAVVAVAPSRLPLAPSRPPLSLSWRGLSRLSSSS